MTTLLEVPEIREQIRLLSVEDYHRLGEIDILSDDVELLRGIVVNKMPKSPLHELVSQKLMKRLLGLVPDGFEVRPERPLTLLGSEPEPDLSVVRGKPDDWVARHPATAVLVVEVAVSSAALDEKKADIYAEAGIPELWLVRPEDRVIDVYREPANGSYSLKVTLGERDRIMSAELPNVQFTVADVFPSSQDSR